MADLVANDWAMLVPAPDHRWQPSRLVSVCIPTRNPGRGLVNTILALQAQTYPHDLLEVVVADDGSDGSIELPTDLPFPVRQVRLERTLDFGAGRARNAAARAAEGEILFFLDADVVPERQVVEAYARWFETRSDLLVMGSCRFVDVGDLTGAEIGDLVRTDGMQARFAGADVDDQDWRESTLRRTDDLRIEAIDAFRITIGATLATSRSQFEEVGGFPEYGVRGVEDTAFGYRLHANGAVLVFDRDAVHWHQGRRHLASDGRAEIERMRAPFVQAAIPVRGFRRGAAPHDPPIPVVPVVRVHLTDDARREAVDAVADPASGANVVLAVEPAATRFDPAFAHAFVPEGVEWPDPKLGALNEIFARSGCGVVVAIDESGTSVRIARGRALRRARRDEPSRDPVELAGELFGVWWTTLDKLGFECRSGGAPGSERATRASTVVQRLRSGASRAIGAAFERIRRNG